MKKIDISCFVGTWPFHKIEHCQLRDLMAIHQRHGIETGFVSSTNAIFYNDPYEAEQDLAEQLKGTAYRQVMTINPTLPGWRTDLRRGVAEMKIAGVRIHPGYHGYQLCDSCVCELMEELRLLQLPLFLTMRMEDERITYLLHAQEVHWSDVGDFLKKHSTQPVLLSNLRLNEMKAIAEIIQKRPQTFVDCAGMKDAVFALEVVRDEYKIEDRLVFGSLATVSCFESMYLAITTANATEELKNRILTGEAVRGAFPL